MQIIFSTIPSGCRYSGLSGRGSVVQGPPDFSVRTYVCLCDFRLHAGFRVYLSVQRLRIV